MTEFWSSVDEVAKHLGVAQDSICRWIEARGMPAHKIGRLWKFKLSEVDQWVHVGGAGGGEKPARRRPRRPRGVVMSGKRMDVFSMRVWLGTFGDAVFLAAFSQQNVSRALGDYGTPMAAPMPKGAVGGRMVPEVPALHRLLRHAFQLSKALPNELLHTFEKRVATLPKATEAERLVIQRVGQNLFGDSLLDLWEGRCAVTGLAVPALLRASHIKPWADCETDAERLGVYNSILLAPHLDTAFDREFITIQNDDAIIVSESLDAGDRSALGLEEPLRVRGVTDGHRSYLPWHRQRVFETWETGGTL